LIFNGLHGVVSQKIELFFHFCFFHSFIDIF
jgi:hypothetical protein